jgi:hypothetical protein
MNLSLACIPHSFRQTIQPFILVALWLLPSSGALAQADFAEHFIAAANKNKVYLQWTILSGNTCNGMLIFRSADNIHFNQIDEIFGVCGSEDSAQTFQYTDEQPEINKTNFYKIQFGFSGNTISQSVFVLAQGGVTLLPNPASSSAQLYFDNSQGQLTTFALYDISGRMLQSMETKNNQVEIDLQGIPAGLYGYLLTLPSLIYKGTLSVVH